jgi:2-oxoglutarate ferredoxin oxidoreductase subunit beta
MILFNNYNYGMTGGQYSPTTPMGSYATTAPYGQPDNPFDLSALAVAAGASFVARGSTYQAAQLDKLIAQGIRKKGFALVEVLTDCTEIYGRRNRLGGPAEMLLHKKEVTVNAAKAKAMSPEEMEGKIITGVIADVDKPEYCESYEKIIKKAQARATASAK